MKKKFHRVYYRPNCLNKKSGLLKMTSLRSIPTLQRKQRNIRTPCRNPESTRESNVKSPRVSPLPLRSDIPVKIPNSSWVSSETRWRSSRGCRKQPERPNTDNGVPYCSVRREAWGESVFVCTSGPSPY